ncbi:MAG: peptide chain release factor N(5)-glutamine methyltransferase [Candidatus Cloacimonetes bacterium]|nr:peptide chain release factor N(5)-glutamine methyltransferase [Candidatus Cloacimonadota bacterium]
MKLADYLIQLKAQAFTSGIAEADYLYIVSGFLGLSRAQLILAKDSVLNFEQLQLLAGLTNRLENQEPPQYILGNACFYGWDLLVNPSVLIPRSETEGLVELVLARVNGYDKILDIGTGSGAIAIALKLSKPLLQVEAIDLSDAALQVARTNAKKLQAEIKFHCGDLFPAKACSYQVIVSNPPYISVQEYATLDARVRNHEPKSALLGGTDGLDFYRRLLLESKPWLSENGFLALEYGATQRQAIQDISQSCGWKKAESYPDLSGRDRYMLIS